MNFSSGRLVGAQNLRLDERRLRAEGGRELHHLLPHALVLLSRVSWSASMLA